MREPVAAEENNNDGGDGDGGGWEDFDADGGDAFVGDDNDPLPDPHANDMQVSETMLIHLCAKRLSQVT